MLGVNRQLTTYFEQLSLQTEVLFEYDSSNNLFVECCHSKQDQIDYLNNSITASPDNIISHVRKIILLQKTDNETVILFCAMVDLFYIMQKNGSALKKRLLIGCKPLLTDLQFDYLHSALTKNILPQCDLWLDAKEWLLFDNSSSKPFVNPIKPLNSETGPQDENIKHFIEDYIQNSQVDSAIELLEKFMLKNPQSVEMGELLMQLYRSINDKHRFYSLYDILREQHTLPLFWEKTASYFSVINETQSQQ